MKLLRFESAGKTHLGVLKDGAIVPLDALTQYPTMLSVILGGDAALTAIRKFVDEAKTSVALSSVRLLAPIERPGKYLGSGLNYRKHMAEMHAAAGVAPPKQQLWFTKQTSCLAGPYDDIDPGVTEKLDYEAELGVVIGAKAKKVTEANALKHVFGYVVAIVVSARDWQFHSQTFTIGKSFDTHGPIGPWIVTADEIPDPSKLIVRCWVNGELRQEAETNEVIFSVAQQIEYLSTAFTLEPGDLLATGTPEGVGQGFNPPKFLKPGDIVRCEVTGVGVIENKVAHPS
jgi:2-keto-4-pentenoate hydratase/2-oxohepta-3-ene-1,7-dioic acid hydratase in catechol pathway